MINNTQTVNDNASIESSSSDNQPLLIQDVDSKFLGGSQLTDFPRIYDNNEYNNSNRNKLKIFSVLLLFICIALAVTLVIVAWKNNPLNKDNKSKREAVITSRDISHFFVLSDLHLDLYYSPNISSENMCRNVNIRNKTSIKLSDTTSIYGRVNCDSPEILIRSALNQMKKLNDDQMKLKFILVPGDMAAHNYEYFDVNEEDSTIWSIGNVTNILSEVQKNVPIFPTMGNNDNFKNYQPPTQNQSDLYKRVAEVIEPHIFNEFTNVSLYNSLKKFRKTFLYGGYYSINMQAEQLKVIVLNTNYWSRKAQTLNQNITVIGENQMAWLYNELEDANKTNFKVIVMGHIPPGPDTFNDKMLWVERQATPYVYQMNLFAHIIIGQIYGHVHTDKLRALHVNDQFPMATQNDFHTTALLISPSITPIYKNSPSFRLFLLDNDEHKLVDYIQYYMDLPASNVIGDAVWRLEYSFQSLYNETLSPNSIDNLVEQLRNTSIDTWQKYMNNLKTNYGGTMLSQRYKEYCFAKHVYSGAYENCIKYYKNAE